MSPIKHAGPQPWRSRAAQLYQRLAGGETPLAPGRLRPVPARLRSSRLVLRAWKAADRAPFARMNASPTVMQYFAGVLSRAESDALFDRCQSHLAEHGWGLWAVEIPGVTAFAGFVGLSRARFEAAFTPCVEIGWRLDERFWGQAYATEGALAALDYGFGHLRLPQIVSFTATANVRSRRVMERIGLAYDPAEDFDHPALPAGHALRRHVLYRKAQPRPQAGSSFTAR